MTPTPPPRTAAGPATAQQDQDAAMPERSGAVQAPRKGTATIQAVAVRSVRLVGQPTKARLLKGVRLEARRARQQAIRSMLAVHQQIAVFGGLGPDVCARASRHAARARFQVWFNTVCLVPAIVFYAAQMAVCERDPSICNAAVLVFAALVAGLFARRALSAAAELGARDSVALGTVAAMAALAVLYASSSVLVARLALVNVHGHLVYHRPAVGQLGLVCIVVAAWEGTLLFCAGEVIRRRQPLARSPLDGTFLRLLHAAGQVAAAKADRTWTEPDGVSQATATIRSSARAAEKAFLSRASRLDRRTYHQARTAGFSLAEVIRSHIPAIATAADPGAYDKILLSMADGITCWARDEAQELMDTIPKVRPPSRLKRRLSRLTPAAILASGAILIPLIPQIAATSAAVSGIRVTLGTGAILALLGGTVSPPEQILGVLDKVTSLGGKA